MNYCLDNPVKCLTVHFILACETVINAVIYLIDDFTRCSCECNHHRMRGQFSGASAWHAALPQIFAFLTFCLVSGLQFVMLHLCNLSHYSEWWCQSAPDWGQFYSGSQPWGREPLHVLMRETSSILLIFLPKAVCYHVSYCAIEFQCAHFFISTYLIYHQKLYNQRSAVSLHHYLDFRSVYILTGVSPRSIACQLVLFHCNYKTFLSLCML